jgi:hypothetical protein
MGCLCRRDAFPIRCSAGGPVQTTYRKGNGRNHLFLAGCGARQAGGAEAEHVSALLEEQLRRRCQEFCVNGFRLVDGFRLHWLHLGGG